MTRSLRSDIQCLELDDWNSVSDSDEDNEEVSLSNGLVSTSNTGSMGESQASKE